MSGQTGFIPKSHDYIENSRCAAKRIMTMHCRLEKSKTSRLYIHGHYWTYFGEGCSKHDRKHKFNIMAFIS